MHALVTSEPPALHTYTQDDAEGAHELPLPLRRHAHHAQAEGGGEVCCVGEEVLGGSCE